ncbi:MAG: hypothetical protein ABEJ59_05225 [Halanaeroarchaeum sp.]
MTSLAAATRSAVDAHPFLRDGLRADVVNYAAAARFLDVDGGEEAIATALRRYAEDLPPLDERDGGVRVTMQSGVGAGDGELLSVGDVGFDPDAGAATAIQAVGDVTVGLLGTILTRLAAQDVAVTATGLSADAMVLVVERRDATTALSIVEDAATGYE